MPPSPSSVHNPRIRRKGVPSKAPSRTLPTTPAINVSLLLRALLREGRLPNALVNTRFPNPPPVSKVSKQQRRGRDVLPPVQAGYGRGKRSVSSSVSVTVGSYDVGGSGRAGSSSREGRRGMSPAGAQRGVSSSHKFVPDVNRMSVKRSQSTEPRTVDERSLGATSRGMFRSSSADPMGHQPLHLSPLHGTVYPHSNDQTPIPSPLSFSFGARDGVVTTQDASDATGNTMRERSESTTSGFSSMEGGAAVSVSGSGRESRKVDAPHHLQYVPSSPRPPAPH
jgi:hypothetical protein